MMMTERARERTSGAERVQKHRDKVLEEGGKRTTVTIQPRAVEASDDLIRRGYARTLTDAINKALIEASQRKQQS
jgi:hypothetical protein